MRQIILALALLVPGIALADWQYIEDRDAFDGETTYILQATSTIPVTGVDQEQHYPVLQLRCDQENGNPYWLIDWYAIIDQEFHSNSIVGVIADISMRVRIDGEEQRGELWNWLVEDDLTTITTARVGAINRRMEGAKELKIRIQGDLGKVHDATFVVSGLDQGVRQLKGHCKRL